MKKLFLLIVFVFVFTTIFAQLKHSIIKSSVTFQIKNLGINTGGSLGGLKADILFDPKNLPGSNIEASINVSTINTDNDTRDEHLKSDSYFDVAKYPKITMKSVSLKHKSGNNYIGTFNLTIKDKTNLTEVPFTYVENGNNALFKGSFKLKRSDFGIGGRSLIMSDDVTALLDIETTKTNYILK